MRKHHPEKNQGAIGWETRDRNGFTLIEMAIVLAIVGILLSMGVELLPMIVKHGKLGENRTAVKDAKAAIIGYALAKGRLPWADTNGDGTENNNREKRSIFPLCNLRDSRQRRL